MQLFQIGEECPSLSQLLIEIGSFNYKMRTSKPCYPQCHVKLEQTNASDESAIIALKNISRLYYGLRCTLVHGKHKRTLEGSLKDFPQSMEDFPLPTTCENMEVIAAHYTRLYTWIKKYGREVWVNYLTLLNTTRFYKTAAYSLMLAVAKGLYDISKTDSRDGLLI